MESTTPAVTPRRKIGRPLSFDRDAALEQAMLVFWRDAARTLLLGAAVAYTGDETPPGCLLASATASGSTAAADVQAAITTIRGAVVETLRARIERDIAEGVLPEQTDAAALARFVMTVLQGLSVMARDGLSRPSLIGIVETALRVWPGEE